MIIEPWEKAGFIHTDLLSRGILFEGDSVKAQEGFVAVPDAIFFQERGNRRRIEGFVETNMRAFTAPMPPTLNFVRLLRRLPGALQILNEVMFGPEAGQITLGKPEDTFFLQLVRRIPFSLFDVAQQTVSLLRYNGGYTS